MVLLGSLPENVEIVLFDLTMIFLCGFGFYLMLRLLNTPEITDKRTFCYTIVLPIYIVFTSMITIVFVVEYLLQELNVYKWLEASVVTCSSMSFGLILFYLKHVRKNETSRD